jgi:uncharacterized membrane protein
MTSLVLSLVTFGAALGAGLIGGVFFAFSNFVMPALAKLPPSQGLAAMQSINVFVLNRTFLCVFTGTAVLCAIAALASLLDWSTAGSVFRFAGSVLYVVGTFAVTMLCNVPMNQRMAQLSPDAVQAAQEWSRYVPEWVTWNTVRTLAALAAASALILSLVQDARAT